MPIPMNPGLGLHPPSVDSTITYVVSIFSFFMFIPFIGSNKVMYLK